MMHGPCSLFNPENPCLVKYSCKRICRNQYFREFTSFTKKSEDGYLLYRRRYIGEPVRIRGTDLDNRWVIPYNPYLLASFDCHMNVEICSIIKAIKYLYKYVYKRHDKIAVNVVPNSEVHALMRLNAFSLVARFLLRRLFGEFLLVDLYHMQPAVMPLQVHLLNKKSVCFKDNEKLEHVVNSESRGKTPLIDFFAYNASHPLELKYYFFLS